MTTRVSLDEALHWLAQHGTKRTLDSMARYGIPSTKAFGVTVGELKGYSKKIGKDHSLAEGLWKSEWYEARMMAAFIDDPHEVNARQMDRWAGEFDSWAICDTVCFALFDRTPHAWSKVHAWAGARAEFKKRAAFALLWGLSVHDKEAPNEQFLRCLPLVETGSLDVRDYVKKGVDMALRALGKRNLVLRDAAIGLATRLCDSTEGAQSWIGRSTQRELTKTMRRKRR